MRKSGSSPNAVSRLVTVRGVVHQVIVEIKLLVGTAFGKTVAEVKCVLVALEVIVVKVQVAGCRLAKCIPTYSIIIVDKRVTAYDESGVLQLKSPVPVQVVAGKNVAADGTSGTLKIYSEGSQIAIYGIA